MYNDDHKYTVINLPKVFCLSAFTFNHDMYVGKNTENKVPLSWYSPLPSIAKVHTLVSFIYNIRAI